MYEIKDGVVCIPAKILYEDLALIPYTTYTDKGFRRKLKFLQRGGNGRIALVSHAHLPPPLKKAVEKAIGKPPADKEDDFLVQYYEVKGETRYFFETYKLPDGRWLSVEDQQEYIANVTMLQAMDAALTDSRFSKRARNCCTPPNWQNLLNEVKRMKYRVIEDESPYWHTLPESLSRLREAYNKYKGEAGMESVIRLGKFNNKNAAKIITDEQIAVMIEFIGNGRNLDYTEVAKYYNTVGKALGWEEITDKAAAAWHKKNERLCAAGRYGKQHYKNAMAMQVKRFAPSSPLLFWSADGWDAELYYQTAKSYTNSLTIEIIIDAYNGYPVGYAIGDRECGDLIKSAMRNALNHMKEIFGERYRTHQVQSDRYAIKAMTPLWETLAKTFTPAEAHNAKAKPIEPWFKHEMQPRCKRFENWSGYGVKSSVKNQVNVDWINQNKKGFPDRAGCVRQLEMVIADIRAEKRDAFVEAFNQMPDSKKMVLSDEMFYYRFGERTLPNKLNGTGVTPTIEGCKYAFDCFDLEFRNHQRERWEIYYDPSDKSNALAVAEGNSQLRFMMEEKYEQPMALADRQEGDLEQLERIREFKKLDEKQIVEERAMHSEIVKSLFEQRAELEANPAVKFLITDRKGQHKDYLKPPPAEEVAYEEVTDHVQDKVKELEYLSNKFDISKYI